MKELRFEAEIVRGHEVPSEVVRERVYGGVRVTADWPSNLGATELRVAVAVSGADRRDAPAYVELFFHDAFLLMNLARPCSFEGVVSVTGGELRVRELTFSARTFGYAAGLATLPLARVVRWYESLGLGAAQVAKSVEAAALFRLLQLARAEEDEETAIVRLASAAEALLGRPESLRRLFELREQIALGRTPAYHPMHDDALDDRVLDATSEWLDVADAAASAVIAALQERVRRHAAGAIRS